MRANSIRPTFSVTAACLAACCLLGCGHSARAAAPAASHFDILDYAVIGNSVLSEDDIGRAVDPYLGEAKTADDIEGARKALNAVYAERGYQTVAVVADQTPIDGVVKLSVVEAKVARLRVVGAEYTTISEVKAEAPSVAEGTVPNFHDISDDLKRLNVAHRSVTPALKPGKEQDQVEVDLNVQDELPITAALEINNDYSANTKPYRLQASFSYDNLFQLGHSLSMSYVTAPQDQDNAQVFSGSYTVPLGGGDFSLSLSGLTSQSNVAALSSVAVLGKGYQIGVRLNWQAPGTDDFSSTLSADLDWKDFDENVVTSAVSSPAPIQYVPMTLAYQAALSEAHANDTATISLIHNLVVASSNHNAFDTKRFDARPDFTIFRGDFTRDQDVYRGVKLHAALGGQVTDGPIINNEAFSLGGYGSVRGFLASEATADNGAHGSLELRSFDLSPYVMGSSDDARWLSNLIFVAFVDGAVGYVTEATPGQKADYALYSTGFGARARFAKYFNVSLDTAWALANGSNTHAGDMRTLFKLGAQFP